MTELILRPRGDQHVDDLRIPEGCGQSQGSVRWRVGELDVRPGIEERTDDGCIAVTSGANQGTAVLSLVVLVRPCVDERSGQVASAVVVGVPVEAGHAEIGQRRGRFDVGRVDESRRQRRVGEQ